MRKAADYSALERLRDGRTIEIRDRPEDREKLLAAIGRTRPQSLRRHFFAPKRGFSEAELAFKHRCPRSQHFAYCVQVTK
jgi:hypothetical protein